MLLHCAGGKAAGRRGERWIQRQYFSGRNRCSKLYCGSPPGRIGSMKTFAMAGMMIALVPTAADAQEKKRPPTTRTEEQMKIDAEVDKAYQNTLKAGKGQAAPVKVDPWQTVRPSPDSSVKR
jgi:hypothetical protein